MPAPSAYLLVSHGSHDPRPQKALEQVARSLHEKIRQVNCQPDFSDTEALRNDAVSSKLPDRVGALEPITQTPPFLVETAYLECYPLALHEQIFQFAERASAIGCRRLQILPLFLLPGVHVMEDIPAEVTIAQETLGEFVLDLRPHLGAYPDLSRLLTTQMATLPVEVWILLSHGSRRASGNDSIAALASQLGALPAYWSVSPSLETRLQELIDLGYRQIGILPYFLFSGGITDAIAQAVDQLAQKFPDAHLTLAKPLDASSELADLVLNLTTV